MSPCPAVEANWSEVLLDLGHAFVPGLGVGVAGRGDVARAGQEGRWGSGSANSTGALALPSQAVGLGDEEPSCLGEPARIRPPSLWRTVAGDIDYSEGRQVDRGQGITREFAEFEGLFALFDGIWRFRPGRAPITVEMMRALSHAGNYVAGAFEGDRLAGGSVGSSAGHPLHSHVTGAAIGRGIGFALKLHQRAWALARELERITWTYDPLVRRNAHFNLAKLGARPENTCPPSTASWTTRSTRATSPTGSSPSGTVPAPCPGPGPARAVGRSRAGTRWPP